LPHRAPLAAAAGVHRRSGRRSAGGHV